MLLSAKTVHGYQINCTVLLSAKTERLSAKAVRCCCQLKLTVCQVKLDGVVVSSVVDQCGNKQESASVAVPSQSFTD